jgi:hypothetical protein
MRFLPSPYSDSCYGTAYADVAAVAEVVGEGGGRFSDLDLSPENLESWAALLATATGTGLTLREGIRRAKARRKAKKDKEGKRRKKKGGRKKKKAASLAPPMTLPDLSPRLPPEEEKKEFPTGLVVGIAAIVGLGVLFIVSQQPKTAPASAKGGK